MKVNLTIKQLEKLLQAAKTAHGEYEAKLGRAHKNWPLWYAKYIITRLQQKRPIDSMYRIM